MIYLDNSATTAVDPLVLEEMLPYFSEKFGNAASRNHAFGWEAADAVEMATERISRLIGCQPDEIIYTSGATESDNLGIKGVFERYQRKGKHLITCKTEHKAVIDSCRHLEKFGAEITYLNVDSKGLIDLNDLTAALRPDTILICLMYANNETGVIQEVSQISTIAREHNVLFMTDATQAVGKIPVDVEKDGIDLMAFTGHKMYGPKGVGALYVRKRSPRVQLASLIDGGGHQDGMRSGTLNVAGIAGFGKAAERCQLQMDEEAEQLKSLRDALENELLHSDAIVINGARASRLPFVANVCFKYITAESIIAAIRSEVAVSTASACSSASLEPSHVLLAMGLSKEDAQSSIRFSLGRFNNKEEIFRCTDLVNKAVAKLRKESPAWMLRDR